MKKYELVPIDGCKSFYGKAIVIVNDNGTETLYSYDTAIIKRLVSGELIKLWDGWSKTTGRHVKAFCGLNKKEYSALPMERNTKRNTGAGYLTPEQSLKVMLARRAADRKRYDYCETVKNM